MANYTKVSKEQGARIELHEKLGLTGAEISINTLPAGEHVPFVHAHKGNVKVIVDKEEIILSQGDWIKIKPAGKRQFFANTDMTYICIQVKENSLESFTAEDSILV